MGEVSSIGSERPGKRTGNGDGMGNDAAARVSVVETTYRILKQRILDNEFPPGFQVLEREVAELLGVSRTPIREILTRLQDEGLVERLPRRGFRVLPLTPADIRELSDVLTCLEMRAGELLAMRGLTTGSEAIRAMAAANEDAAAAVAIDDREGWAAADSRFHRSILRYCGNRHLARTGFAVWDQFHRADMITLRLRPNPKKSPVEHRAIIDALLAGDPKAVRDQLASHRRNGRESIIATLESIGLKHL